MAQKPTKVRLVSYERLHNLPFIVTLIFAVWFQWRFLTKHSYIPSSCFEKFWISRSLLVTLKSRFNIPVTFRFRPFFLQIIVTEPLLSQTIVTFLPAVSNLGTSFLIRGFSRQKPPKLRRVSSFAAHLTSSRFASHVYKPSSSSVNLLISSSAVEKYISFL